MNSSPLHEINPLRLDWIDAAIGLAGKRILDFGCGGGLVSEGMAVRGAEVTVINLTEKPLSIAKLHLLESGQKVDYRKIAVEELATEVPGSFDAVTCLEMLEHVPDPASTIQACARLVKPGGHVFFSTINRKPKSYLFAIIGAEYVLRMLPQGTHDFRKFIRPSELDGDAAVNIGTVAAEQFVCLHREQDIEVARGAATESGFAFTGQTNAATALDTGGDFDLQRFFFFDAALACTFFARVADDFSRAVTGGAGAFDGEETLLHAHTALTVTGRALFFGSAGFGAGAAAFIAGFVGRDFDSGLDAFEGFFERDVHRVLHVGAALRAGTPATAIHHVAVLNQDISIAILKARHWVQAHTRMSRFSKRLKEFRNGI